MISSSSGSSSSGGGASNSASSVTTPPPTVPLDPSQPTTSLQIRLADGSRLTAKFNHTHTVNDVRQYIDMYPNDNLLIIRWEEMAGMLQDEGRMCRH